MLPEVPLKTVTGKDAFTGTVQMAPHTSLLPLKDTIIYWLFLLPGCNIFFLGMS